MWMTLYDIKFDTNEERASLNAAVANGCVLDSGWAAVLVGLADNSTLLKIKTWLSWLVGVGTFTWVLGFFYFLSALRKVGRVT